MQAVLCLNQPSNPPMPLGATGHAVLAHRNDVTKEEPQLMENIPYDLYDGPSEDYRDAMIEQITPESLDECSDMGHQRQAWLIMSEQQEDAVTCPACGRTPDFYEKMTSGEVGPCDYISEILNETHMAVHDIVRDEDAEELTFVFQSGTFQYAKEWPKPASTHLTRLPFPGEDAITLRWLRDEWNQRDDDHLGEHEVLLDPYTNEPFTDETLREFLAECREDGFSYEQSATDIVNTTRGIPFDFDDDDDGC